MGRINLIVVAILTSFLWWCVFVNQEKPVTPPANSDQIQPVEEQIESQTELTGSIEQEVAKEIDSMTWEQFTGTIETSKDGEVLFIECFKSDNAKITKKVQFTMNDLKDPAVLAAKKKDTVNLINNCFVVEIVEEYEVRPGEISTVVGKFVNKIVETDSIFSSVLFYPNVDVLDYEWFAWTEMVSYVTMDPVKTVYEFYKSYTPQDYVITESVDNKSVSYFNESEKKTIKVVLDTVNWMTKIDYELVRIFDAGY